MSRIFTLGHSNRTEQGLLAVLDAHGVRTVCDVRSFPRSRRNPHFDRDALEASLGAAGVRYVFLGREIGGHRRSDRDDSPHTEISDPLFRAYADHLESEDFARGVEVLLAEAGRGPVAAMCAERDPKHCHRSFLADVLVALHDREVVHLVDEGPARPHRLRESARVEDGRLVYDVKPGGSQLSLF